MAQDIKKTNPYNITVEWVVNGEPKQSFVDVKMASIMLHELEIKKGIKAKFNMSSDYIQ